MAAEPGRVDRRLAARRRGRRSRTSSPGGGRRGCRSRRPRSAASAVDREVVAVDLDPGAERAQAGGDARRSGPIPCGGARPRRGSSVVPARGRRREAQDRDLVDGRGDVGRAEVDRRAARMTGRRGRRAARRRRRSAVREPAAGRSSMSAPIARRMSMTARRVGLTPTSRSVSSASGWIAPATSQNAAAETSPGTRSIDRLHRRPSFAPSTATAPSGRPRARPARPAPAASAPCGRASRPPRGRSSAPPLAARPAGSADFTCALGTGVVKSIARSGVRPTTVRGGRESFASAVEHRAHRAQRLDDTSDRTAAQRRVAVEDAGHRQPGEDARR